MASLTASVARRAFSQFAPASTSAAAATATTSAASSSSTAPAPPPPQQRIPNNIPPRQKADRLKGKARCVIRSHVGSTPLLVPPQASFEFLCYPPHTNPTKSMPKTLFFATSVRVKGPLGEMLVPHFDQIAIKKAEEQGKAGSSKGNEAEEGYVTWNVQAGTPRKDGHNYLNGRWGLTRQLLYNAVKGVTEGHSIVLRLVGVGYRATVEDEDRHVESDLEKWFKPGTRTFFVSKVQEEAYRNMLAAEREKKEPWKRLALRLGYSHPVLMTIPRGITASTPTPTRIVLKGVDIQQLGQFAAKLRAFRPPEPYKGKGVFVNDEQIKLKSAKKK